MSKTKIDFSEERKKEIIQAAWKSFREKGYEKTTIREIAKQMDSTTGLIYNYFKTKGEIIEEMQAQTSEHLEKFFAEINKEKSVKIMFGRLLENQFRARHIKDAKKIARGKGGLLAEALRSENIRKAVNSRFHEMETGFSQIFEEGIRNGEIQSHVDPKSMADFYIALRWGLRMQLAIVDDFDIDSYLKNLKKILLGNIWAEMKK